MSKDVKFFNPTKKGELHEMKQELDSGKPEKQKVALKSVIAAMTVGKDVSVLFPDIVKCIQTPDLELKKLVYLYVMNYAKSQPDLAILAVNTFVTDSTRNPNPLIRALAIRTMGCIRVEKITEYLCQPLHLALKDSDPYVRKTAVICVSKLYEISPELVASQGFIDSLLEKLEDINSMVVSNSVAALCEIEEQTPGSFELNPSRITKIVTALPECTEWGQIYILNCLATHVPRDSREAEQTIERVVSRLNHNNCAVVLGAIRVIMSYLDHIPSGEYANVMCKKLSGPLVTLLSKEPEVQYIALRNINLILQKRPTILANQDISDFFCKYNDPIYVKMEKLEIVIMLASENTIDQVLLELKEYATEADVEFVRKSVRAIGRCAVKLEKSAERCIHVLLQLIQSDEKYNAVVQEAIVVIKDIFRKYPNRYESIIGQLCENLSTLDEPEAKAAMIWIIGEYADRIENADELLFGFLDSFLDEDTIVQQQLLTATVKLFLKRPKNTKTMVLNVLSLVTNECDNPDLRDRGFIYWRLLTDPKAARSVVLNEKPLIEDDSHNLDPAILDELIQGISSIASVYHKPAEVFVPKQKRQRRFVRREEEPLEDLGPDRDSGAVPNSLLQLQSNGAHQQTDLLGVGVDLLGISSSPVPSSASSFASVPSSHVSASVNSPVISSSSSSSSPLPDMILERKILLAAEKADGLQISAAFANKGGQLFIVFNFHNQSSSHSFSQLMIQFNRNFFGLAPSSQPQISVAPGQSIDTAVSISFSDLYPPPGTPPSPFLQIAVKASFGSTDSKVYFFQDVLPFKLLLRQDGRLEKKDFLDQWKSLPSQNEHEIIIQGVKSTNVELVQRHLEANHVFTIAVRKYDDKNVLYCSSRLWSGNVYLVEFTFRGSSNDCGCSIKTTDTSSVSIFVDTLNALLRG